jgi:hypothetical protein
MKSGIRWLIVVIGASTIPVLAFVLNTDLGGDFVIRFDYPNIRVGSIETSLGVFDVSQEVFSTLLLHSSFYLWIASIGFVLMFSAITRPSAASPRVNQPIELTAFLSVFLPLLVAAFTTAYLSKHTLDYTTLPRVMLYAHMASLPYFLVQSKLILDAFPKGIYSSGKVRQSDLVPSSDV